VLIEVAGKKVSIWLMSATVIQRRGRRVVAKREARGRSREELELPLENKAPRKKSAQNFGGKKKGSLLRRV